MEEQQTHLRDYVNIITKRKWWAIATFLLFVAAGLWVSIFRTPNIDLYEVSAMVRAGSIEGVIMTTDEAKVIMRSNAILESLRKKQDLDKSISGLRNAISIGVFDKTDFLSIGATTRNPQAAEKICAGLCAEYIAYGNNLYEKQEALVKGKYDILKKQISEMENALKEDEELYSKMMQIIYNITDERQKLSGENLGLISQEIENTEKEIDNIEKQISRITEPVEDKTSQLALLQNTIADYKLYLVNLKQVKQEITMNVITLQNSAKVNLPSIGISGNMHSQAEKVQRKIESYESGLKNLQNKKYDMEKIFLTARNFTIINPPGGVRRIPRTDKKKVVMVMSVLGLIFGLFLVFFIDYWQGYKKESTV